jgi:hypothetical protein
MQYAINNMDEPIPQIHLYDYFAYLDLIIFLYIFNSNDRASYNKKHQQQIENTFAHASSSSGGVRNMTVYNHRINDDIGNLLHYFLLCKSCLWCASYIHHISNMANPNFADILRSRPLCLNQRIDFMPLSPYENYIFSYSNRSEVTLAFNKYL